jgi:hypothetical protein
LVKDPLLEIDNDPLLEIDLVKLGLRLDVDSVLGNLSVMLPLAVLLPSPDTFSDFSPAVLAVFEPDDAIGESLSSLLTLLGVFGGSDATLFLSSFRKEVTALAGELLPLPFLLIVARRSFKEVFEPSLTDPPPLPAFCDRHWSLILSTSPIAGPLCCYHSVECKMSHALIIHRPPLHIKYLAIGDVTSASSAPTTAISFLRTDNQGC